jgi:hypothetical protein
VGEVEFNHVMFRVDRDPTRIVMFFTTGGEPKTVIQRFDGTGFVDCVPRESRVRKDTGEDFAAWRKRVALQILATDRDNLRTTNPEWRDVLNPGATPKVGSLLDLKVVE